MPKRGLFLATKIKLCEAGLCPSVIRDHSKAHHPISRPEQPPRARGGNVSKSFGALSDGSQGNHAIAVGEQLQDATEVPIKCE